MKKKKKVFRGRGSLVSKSDQAGDWRRLDTFNKKASKLFVGIDRVSNEITMSENHPYFSIQELDARARLRLIDKLSELFLRILPRKTRSDKVHANNAEACRSYRKRKKEATNGNGLSIHE